MRNLVNSLLLSFTVAAAPAGAGEHCTPAVSPETGSTQERLVALLEQSQAGKAALDSARKTGTQICLYAEYDGRVGYYIDNKIMLHAATPLMRMTKTAAHELRHKMQSDAGFSAATDQTPRAMILSGKIMEADAEAFANRVFHELEQKGHDVSGAFANGGSFSAVRDAFRHGIRQKDGNVSHATRAAFDAWFGTSIASFYEQNYLDTYLRLLDETPYHHPTAYAHRHAERDRIEALGTVLPENPASNYILQTGGFDIGNPRYAAMLTPENDRKLAEVEEKIRQKRQGPFTP